MPHCRQEQTSGINFSKKKELELNQDVLKQAVKEAAAKAEAITQGMGRHLGKVVSVTENGVSFNSNNRFEHMYAKGAEASDSKTEVTLDVIQISGTVNMVFEII